MYKNLPPLVIPEDDAISDVPTNPDHLELSNTMYHYIETAYPADTTEGMALRNEVLEILRDMLKTWIKFMAVANGIPAEDADSCGGCIFVSGSFRLGVCVSGSDIDVICVVPSFCGGEEPGHFFKSFFDQLNAREDVTNLVPIPGAAVPMIAFMMRGIDIDLIPSIRPSADATLDLEQLLVDQVLQGVDEKSARALNGPRVTEILYLLTEHNYDHFRLCLRCLRFWSKKRGIYSNKLGYLGGVNFAILAAKAVQWIPKGSAFTLMQYVFQMMITHPWPNEIRLTKHYDPPGMQSHEQWEHPKHNEVMPIITPAYPTMNSTFSVNKFSFSVMQKEFKRAAELCETISAKISKRLQDGESSEVCSSEWAELFEPVQFFARSKYYLRLDIVALSAADLTTWQGFAESRVRLLIIKLEPQKVLSEARVFPKPFTYESAEDEQGAGSSSSDGHAGPLCGQSIYIGLTTDPGKLRGTLNLQPIIAKFRRDNLSFPAKKPGMDIKVKIFTWKQLPDVVFGEEGREAYRGAYKAFKKEQSELKEKAEQERKEKQDEWAQVVERGKWEMNQQGNQSSHEKLGIQASETERTSTNMLSSGSLPQVTATVAAAAAAAASAASDHAIAAVNAAYGVTNSSSAATSEDVQIGTGDAVHDVSAIPRPVPQQQQNKRKKKNKSKPTKKRRVDVDLFD